jgi:transposase-like protein
LSYRDIEKMMAERGIVVSYESIREQASKKFFRKLLKGMGYVPRGMVSDKWRSYA